MNESINQAQLPCHKAEAIISPPSNLNFCFFGIVTVAHSVLCYNINPSIISILGVYTFQGLFPYVSK